MEPYEMEAVIDGLSEKHKESWEQTRFISYIIAQVNSTKTLKPSDVIKFPWDHNDSEDYYDKDEMRLLKEKVKELNGTKTN